MGATKNQILKEIELDIEQLNKIITGIRKMNSTSHLLEKDLLKSVLRNLYTKIDLLEADTDLNIEPQMTQDDIIPETRSQSSIRNEVMAAFSVNHQPTGAVPESAKGITPPAEISTKTPEAPDVSLRVVIPEPIASKPQAVIFEETADVTAATSTVADLFHAAETLGDKIQRSATEKSVSENLKHLPLSDLHQSIGINERFAFINGLFKGDQPLYFSTIDRLNAMTSFEEANHFLINEMSDKLTIKKNKELFEQFTELIHRRFDS